MPAAVTTVIGYCTPLFGAPPGRVPSVVLVTSRLPVSPDASDQDVVPVNGAIAVMLPVGIGIPFHWTWVTVSELAPSFVIAINRLPFESS